MTKPFTHLLRVRYADCDAQQVVFNAKYVEYIDVAMTEFVRALLGGYEQMLSDGFDNQVVNVNVVWKAPAKFDDIIAITAQVKHIGRTSYTMSLNFSDYHKGHEVAQAEIVYVIVSADQHVKMPVPDGFRDKLERGAPGVVSDHAGV